ncbi:hypothetical protein [Sinomonas atrocyanea]
MGWKSRYRRQQWLLRNERRISALQTVLLGLATVATVAFIVLNIHR